MNEQSLFAAALAKRTGEEREAFLSEACGENATLRAQVEDLLKAEAAAGSFLEHPPVGIDVTIEANLSGKDTVDSGLRSSLLPFLEPCDKPDRIGKLGDYEIIEVVGQGGMGTVLRAFETKLSRIVAVKVMAPELAANPEAVKRFLREARTAAAVHHDHVVTIHAIDDTHRPPFIVMQFVEGQTLQQKIDNAGALELRPILRIGSQMAAGLAAAHKTGLIHRDVKPGNILLENGVERVKITDFGLARAADDVEMTRQGMIAGTPQYMSPEQAHGGQIDFRSDLFSLGSVLYTMCTGRPAFRAETTMATLRRVSDNAPRPIRELNPEIPDWLEAIVLKLLAKKPEDRFQSATEVKELLEQHLAHVQNPALTPQPELVAFPTAEKKPLPAKPQIVEKMPLMVPQGIRWPLIAATGIMLLIAVVLLVITESTGVTEFFGGSAKIEAPVTPPPQPIGTESVPPDFDAGKWVSLFNARDLTGWTAIPPQHWKVEGGVIKGSGSDAFLITKFSQFEDFHLLVEYRINAEGDSGVHFRMPPPEPSRGARWGYAVTGLEAEIGIKKAADYATGALTVKDPGTRVLATSTAPPHAANEWVRLEVMALKDHILILVNGQPVTDYVDKERKFQRAGHIALASWEDGKIKTNVEFRKIEIKKLPDVLPGSSADVLTSPDWEWTEPENLGPAVNSRSDEQGPHLAADGLTLIFGSDRPGGSGNSDLWMCTRPSMHAPWSPATNLGSKVNSTALEWLGTLSRDGLTLVYSSAAVWEGSRGGQDLWMTTRQSKTAEWSTPANLGSPVNGPKNENAPALSSDGLTLIFESDRAGGSGDLWMSTRQDLASRWSQPVRLGPGINSQDSETAPSLSADSLTLLYSSTRRYVRSGGFGTWITTRRAIDQPWSPAIWIPKLGNSTTMSADGTTVITSFHRNDSQGRGDLYQLRRVSRKTEIKELLPTPAESNGKTH